jgi:hypothetical protein
MWNAMTQSIQPDAALCALAGLLLVQACLSGALCWALQKKDAAESAAGRLAGENDLLRVRLHGSRQREAGVMRAVRALRR